MVGSGDSMSLACCFEQGCVLPKLAVSANGMRNLLAAVVRGRGAEAGWIARPASSKIAEMRL